MIGRRRSQSANVQRIMKENSGLDPKRLFLCINYRHKSGMKYGYARVSTDGQSVDAQVRQLTKAGCKKVFREVASGAKTAAFAGSIQPDCRKSLQLLTTSAFPFVPSLPKPLQFQPLSDALSATGAVMPRRKTTVDFTDPPYPAPTKISFIPLYQSLILVGTRLA
jgi:hypothetical protein